MRILDVNDHEVVDPDLTKGYLQTETLILAHHDAVEESPAEYETVEIEPGLMERKVIKPWTPGKGAWDETEQIQRYIEYTAEELKEQEEQKRREEEENKKAEEEAEKQAALQAAINALPQRVEDIEEGVAEVGVMAADAATSIDELMEAVAEIGVMVAEMQEQ